MSEVNYLLCKKGVGEDSGAAISGDLGNGGDQSSLPEQQETNIEAGMLENVEPGGATIIIGDSEGGVDDVRLELREEPVQCVRKTGILEENRF